MGQVPPARRRLTLEATGPDGTRRVAIGSHLAAGERVGVGIERVERSFALGDRVALTPADFVEIASTFVLYAQELGAAIRAMQDARYAAQGDAAPE